jgi:hypothetical protein
MAGRPLKCVYTAALALAALAAGVAMPGAAQPRPDTQVARCPATLPASVAAKRQSIIEPATRRDWAALGRLTGPGFQWGGYEDGDPVPAWRSAVDRGEDPAVPLLAILNMPCVVIRAGTTPAIYTWPSAVGVDWKALDAAERSALQALYGARIDGYWLEGRAKGYYVGWSVGIDAQGAWKSFTIGD